MKILHWVAYAALALPATVGMCLLMLYTDHRVPHWVGAFANIGICVAYFILMVSWGLTITWVRRHWRYRKLISH